MITSPTRSSIRFSAAVALVAAVALAQAASGNDNRLQDITEKWRRTRAQDVPVAAYLRALVRSDSGFAVDSTMSPAKLGPKARAVFEGLAPILAPELQMQFLGLSSDSLRIEWLRRYWRLRDPTPTTPENERLEVHEQRVAQARSEFASKNPPGWDDRGTIWIAYGAPDSTIEETANVEEGVGFTPAHQEWLYLQERWVVEFERPNPRGPWKLGRSSARVSYQPDLVARDRERLGYGGIPSDQRGAGDDERMGDVIGFQEERELLAQDIENNEIDAHADRDMITHNIRTDMRAKDLIRRRKEGLVRFSKQYEHGGERFTLPGTAKPPLWYVFDVDVFKGPPGRMRVEVHYQFNLQDLKFGWRDSLYAASYHAEGVLLDGAALEAARDEYTERIKADDFRSTMSAQLVPGQLAFNVPEGAYRLGIRLVDPASGAEGTYTTRVEVPELDGRKLALSDVQMASSIVYAGDDWRSRFVKKDRLIVPNPIGAYAHGKQLTGYFEIYGLKLNPEGASRYEVKYSIAPRSLTRAQGWLPAAGTVDKPFVTSSFTNEAGASDVEEELRVNVDALATDTYELVLTVHDLVSGGETTSRTGFSLLN
jgi:GWxTD domain-containing protein